MKAPITYYSNFIANADIIFANLRDQLDWERRKDAPRDEYYCNDFPKSYIYGIGKGAREYSPRPYHSDILEIRGNIEGLTNSKFEVCFLNRYLNQSDSLGWHSDNSPEMDDARPIAIVSLGVEREIWFRQILGTKCICCGTKDKNHKMDCYIRDKRKEFYGEVEKLKLGHGSLCLMAPGMQDFWQHRIPKADFKCGERISLTYRGYNELL